MRANLLAVSAPLPPLSRAVIDTDPHNHITNTGLLLSLKKKKTHNHKLDYYY